MVGLRWWSYIKDDGSEEWVYECANNMQPNQTDNTVFWGFQYLATILWATFAILSVMSFSLNGFFLCLVGFALSGTNLLNYIRCQKNHRQMVQGFLWQKTKENVS